MSDVTPDGAEEVERDVADVAPEEAAMSPDQVVEEAIEEIVEEAVIEEIIEEIVEEAVLEAIEEAVVEEIAEEIVEEIVLETETATEAATSTSGEPDLVLDAPDGQDAADEDGELGGWVKD